MKPWTFALMGLLGLTTPVHARCGLCCLPSLRAEAHAAKLVLYGTIVERRSADGNAAPAGDKSELQILEMLKSHPALEGRDVLRLGRDVPIDDPKNPPRFLVFCDVSKGKIDPYRGLPASPRVIAYLKGALALERADRPTQLRYFLDHLRSPDSEAAGDAFREIEAADYADLRGLATKLSAAEIAPLLQKTDILLERRCLAALLLGHCGKPEHAELIRRFLDDPKTLDSSAADRAVVGYVLLRPKDGAAYLEDLIKEPSADFLRRYAGLRAVQFFWDERPDVIGKQELLANMYRLLGQPDIADLAIEDLRKWKHWEALDQVLGLDGQKSHDIPIVRRAVLRYALCCPGQKAIGFVAAKRTRDARWVAEVEELLKLEAAPMK